MNLKIIGSSSAGNAYGLENDREALLIEAGVNLKKIKQALNFNVYKVVGCLVTHSHQDHCRAAKDVLNAGIRLYATGREILAMGLPAHHRLNVIEAGHEFKVGNFRVLPFEIKHDTPEPVGFLINHTDCGNVLFLTDSYYSPFVFSGLNNLIVECNHSIELLSDQPAFLRNRIAKSHMSINTLKDLLRANDLSRVNKIVLIHLSDNNSNSLIFNNEIKELTGKNVHIAESGYTFNLNKTPI